MNKQINAIFVGTSNLLYKLAEKTCEYYKDCSFIKIFDVTKNTLFYNKKCKKFNIEIKRIFDKSELMNLLSSVNKQTIIFSVNNPFLFSKSVVENNNLTIINLHHSLLPLHRGRNGEAWTIYSGDNRGGITWHFVNEDTDSGEILLQEYVELNDDITSIKLLKLSEELAINSFNYFLPLENIKFLPKQPQTLLQEINYTSDIPNDGFIDLSCSIEKQIRFLNAMNYGGLNVLGDTHLRFLGKNYKIVSYKAYHEVCKDCSESILIKKELDSIIICDNNRTLCLKIKELE